MALFDQVVTSGPSPTATVETNLFVSRAIASWNIFLGLLAIVVGEVVVYLIAFATDWGLLVLAVAPLGFGWYRIARALPGLYRRVISNAPGTSRWATIEDLKKADVVGKNVNPRHHIYCGLFDRVPVHDDSDRHIVTLGATRRGKDTSLFVQNLALLDESFVVLDPSGELTAITIESRKKRGLAFVFNPYGLLVKTHPHLKSSGFNPIPLTCSPDDDNFFAQGMGFGESILPRGSIRDSHWDEGAMQLGMVLWMRAKWFQKEGKVPHATVRHVIDMASAPYNKKGVKNLKGIMEEITRHSDEQMVKLAQRFVAEDDDRNDEIRGVLSTAAGKIKSLNDRTILADMDKHPLVDGKPFDFEMLKHRVITVYIILPDEMLKTHATWLRLVVANAINALKRSPPGPVRPILLLNEIGNLGYMESLDTAMGMIAKKGVRIWTAWQSLAQITRIYGDHGRETFLSGAGLNAFKADDLETAEYLSKRLGRRTEVVSSYNAKTGETNASKTDSASGFPLMHPDQIMALPPRTLLSWIDRLPRPVHLNAPGYFDMPSIKGMAPNPYYVERRA